ncbi:hypothetical protein NECAME_10513 [Necator americanus]|uniref:Uncharacterized protein n=1 Tax=Necator americanus TaxID=51031 RepID=W2TAZ9_NECAM|nr:hypothetical protein NECAME_10513 [Necator americanus]ETN78192.1 hypothetical protein NECAME_10513 [Necator americanus]
MEPEKSDYKTKRCLKFSGSYGEFLRWTMERIKAIPFENVRHQLTMTRNENKNKNFIEGQIFSMTKYNK